MKNTRKIGFSILVLLILCISSSQTSYGKKETARANKAEWTFIQYHDVDNNLGVYGYEDLVEMCRVGSSEQVNVVVLYDTLEEPAEVYYIESGRLVELEIAGLSGIEVDMGSPDTVTRFLEYVFVNFPANKYLLNIWDHGDDFRGACKDSNPGDNFDPDNSAGSQGFLYHYELRDALQLLEAKYLNRDKIDILAFDACVEGMIEVADYHKDVADYLLGSEDYISYHGFPYDTWFQKLKDNPYITPQEFAEFAVDSHVDQYLKDNGAGGGGYVDAFPTLSSIQLGKIPILEQDLDIFLRDLATIEKGYDGVINSARAKSLLGMPIYGWDADIDLYTFIKELSDGATTTQLRDEGDKVLDDIVSFVYTKCSHQYSVKSAYGLGIFFPPSPGSVEHNEMLTSGFYFEKVPFAQSEWGTFLQTYFGLT